jgi:hypothetical protein
MAMKEFGDRVQFGFISTYLLKIPLTVIPICVAYLAFVRGSFDMATMQSDAWSMFVTSLTVNSVLFVAMFLIYGRKQ